jgi:hypothetical protein
MPTNTFPLEPQTEIQISTAFNPYRTNFIPGEKTQYLIRDVIPPTVQEFSAKFYTDSLSSIETFLKGQKGYIPFYFLDKPYVCKSYTLSFLDDNKGYIELALSLYTNQAP